MVDSKWRLVVPELSTIRQIWTASLRVRAPLLTRVELEAALDLVTELILEADPGSMVLAHGILTGDSGALLVLLYATAQDTSMLNMEPDEDD
jgi:hypothetical protein